MLASSFMNGEDPVARKIVDEAFAEPQAIYQEYLETLKAEARHQRELAERTREALRFIRNQFAVVQNEADRTLIALASGGILLLVTALRPDEGNPVLYWLWIVSAIAFVFAVLIGVGLFEMNARHLLALVYLTSNPKKERDTSKGASKLEKTQKVTKCLHWLLRGFFCLGVLLTTVFALVEGPTPTGDDTMARDTDERPAPGGTEERGLQDLESLLDLPDPVDAGDSSPPPEPEPPQPSEGGDSE